jgi:protein MpaA
VKSVLTTTKFKLQAQARPHKKRLEVPLNRHSPPPPSGSATLKDSPSRSQAAKLLDRLDQLSQPRARLYSSPISAPPHYRWPEIPRYIFVGDQPGESEIRLGIFAGLRGDDNAGAKAIVEFIDDLVTIPSLGSAFRIYAYPTANPLSYTAGSPRRQTDRTVANETGRKLRFPEAELIEREIFVVQFHGVVIIHTTDEPEGLQAAVYGANLHEALVSPILSSLQPLFPATELPVLDSSFSLTADAVLKQRPFELALGIPRSGWRGLYSMGLRVALHTAVEQYRSYLAQANNI